MRSARFLLLWLAVTLARPAHAQSTTAQADLLFQRGRDLMAAGQIDEACAAFEASNKLEPAATTLLNLGACREKQGHLASAYGAYSSAERQARQATDSVGRELARVAADHVARLEPRVSKLTIRVPEASRVAGLEIVRGSDVVDPATWNFPLALDGGKYEISARAPGHAGWTTTVTVERERGEAVVTVPVLPAVAEEHDEGPPPPRAQRPIAPYVVGAVALGALASSLAFELWGRATYDESKVERDWIKQDQLWESANRKRYAAEGLAAGGLACAAIAAWLYVRGEHASTAPLAVAHPGGLAIGLAGTF